MRYSNFAKFAAAAVIICIGTLALLTFTDRFEFNTSGTVQTKNTTDTGANQTVTDTSKMGIKEKIKLAGELLSQNRIASLIALLNDPDLNVRLTAYKALKNSNDPQAIAAVSAFAAQLEELSNQTPDLQQITPAAEPNESELINAPADTQGNLLFKTVDQLTGMLLGNVKLDIKWEGKEQYNDVTNSEGVCNIDFEGQRPGDIRIVASLPGFVPKTFYYTKYYDKAFIIPKSHTMTLERGTSISGRIVNQQQEPISGASVFVTIQTDIAQQRISEYNFVNDHKVLTDTNGFWSCDVIPDNADKVNLRLSHPDYIDDEYSGRTISTSTPIENLRSGNIVSVMKKGIPVTGIVVDRQGNPIKSATINKGEYTSDAYKCRTNPQGQFNLGHVKPGLALITVSAKGFAPQLEELDINQDTEPLVFTLEPAQSIYGQMVDQDDKPISGVWINVDSWRGYRTLDNGSYRTRTGKDGNFELKNMPNEEMLFSIYKPGYLSINKLPMSCDTAKYTIVLYPPVNAKGSVTDADTNEPIKQFTLTEGILWQGQENVSWQTHSSRIKTMQGPDYNYDFTSGGADGFTIRIAADGYLPQDSNIFYIDQQNIVCDFKLKKADNITGTVLSAEGNELKNVQIALCSPRYYIGVTNGRLQNKNDFKTYSTNQDGWFSIPPLPQDEKYSILFLHDSGYAVVKADQYQAGSEITLTQWSGIEGNLIVGDKPASGENIAFWQDRSYNSDQVNITFEQTVVTDANGSFKFEKLPAGPAKVGQRIYTSERSWTYTNTTPVETLAGEIVNVQLGGQGRPVVGRFALPDSYKHPVSWNGYYASIKKDHKSYAIAVGSDGSFRAENVKAGNYSLTMTLKENDIVSNSDGTILNGETIGTATLEITVADCNETYNPEPLDLDTIILKTKNRPMPGDTAPPLELKTIGGKAISLNDFAGKMTMLVFASFDQSYYTETFEKLKTAWQPFENSLACFYVSVYDKPSSIEYIQQSQLEETTGLIDDNSRKSVYGSYGISSLPVLILIDENGTVLLRNPSKVVLKNTILNLLK